MKNPIAISILIVGILFTALYGWLNRHEYQVFVNNDRDFQTTLRINRFTLDRCVILPPHILASHILNNIFEEICNE